MPPENSLRGTAVVRARNSCALDKSLQETTILQDEIRTIFSSSKRETKADH